MRSHHLTSRNKSRSLPAQIKDAERQILVRQGQVGLRANRLSQTILQQMTTPASLLLASGIGFIIGELTRQTSRCRAAADKSKDTKTTPLKTALNLLSSIQTLYAALPLAWMVKSYYRQGAPGPQSPERRISPMLTFGAASSRRRPKER
ncbi:MAG: hypothetical protein WAW36_06685 [Methylovulum miyakonense]|uniref:hypothetical protein n=1 Tax=Methylovulum miyakonense TaxID=645578 RepID=UPI003BB7C130